MMVAWAAMMGFAACLFPQYPVLYKGVAHKRAGTA